MYAEVEDLSASHRPQFLNQWIGGIPEEDREEYLESLLASASGRMNAAFKRGRLPVPIVEAGVAAEFWPEISKLLRNHCCNLAVGQLLAGAQDLPEGPKKAYDMSVEWLKDIASGAQELAGVERATGTVLNYSFVQDGENPSLVDAVSWTP